MPRKIQFYRTGETYGAFSNFSRHAIYAGGKIWPTSEHYFQAMKFEDHLRQELIRRAKTPGLAAKMGRDRAFPIREDWDDHYRDKVMLHALRCKFSQHPDLHELLKSTRDAILIEHTSRDSYWGDGGDGTGENKLGQLLMEIRTYLKPGDKYL